MNGSQLKLIAIFIMLIDHIGAILLPKVYIFRVIGRMAFPIFAYFITEGFFKTSDFKKYAGRLFIFALISQIPFYLAFKEIFYLNVFFTLFFGLYAIHLYDESKNIGHIWLMGILAQICNTDYGIYGIFTIYFFYKYHEDFKTMAKKQIFFNVIFIVIASILELLWTLCSGRPINLALKSCLMGFVQALCLLSLILIKHYNGERGAKLKYLFYGFYPVHLLALWMIKTLV